MIALKDSKAWQMIESVRAVPGALVECGVRQGYTLAYLMSLFEQQGHPRTVYGFDAWAERWDHTAAPLLEGEPTNPPTDRRDYSDIPFVFQRLNLNMEDVHLIRGWFSETLPATDTGPIAFLHLDADVYSSYCQVLQYLGPKINVGGLVVLDEYHSQKWWGAKKAVDEFLSQDKAWELRSVEVASHQHYYLCRMLPWLK